MGGETSVSGPDLTLGLPAVELEDGAMVVGHVGDEAVLVARRGHEVFAIGATCTHYSGPLAEGRLEGDTVRCPWHHACFSLRTGEAIRAPALNPVACWHVDQREDRIYVTRKIEPELPQQPDPAPASVVIVGAGAAGNAAAEMLRREGYEGPITLIGADAAAPYDRPNLSKDYLAGNAPEEWIPLRPSDFYGEKRIDLRAGRTVRAIHPDRHQIELDDGSTLPYGVLLLATGAEPVHLDISGHVLPHVRYLRTLADSRAIIASTEGATRAVVMGASFIGLEVAASLRARGLEVHVVAPEAQPLTRVMGPQIGALLRRVHEEHGVVFHLEQTATAIDREAVTLGNGERIPADLVVIGVGVRPALELARRADLKIDRGVVVDEFLRTTSPDIYAAGDIARWPDPHTGGSIRVEHWVVAERQGQCAARNMLGRSEPFTAVPFFWSTQYDLTLAYVGHAERWDRIDLDGSLEARDCAAAFRQGERTLAVVTIGRDQVGLAAEVALERDDHAALLELIPVGTARGR